MKVIKKTIVLVVTKIDSYNLDNVNHNVIQVFFHHPYHLFVKNAIKKDFALHAFQHKLINVFLASHLFIKVLIQPLHKPIVVMKVVSHAKDQK